MMETQQVAAGRASDMPEKKALKAFWEAYDSNYEQILEKTIGAALKDPEFGPTLEATPPGELAKQNAASRELMRRAILQGEWEPYLQNLRNQGHHYAQAGVSFGAWFKIVGAFRVHILPSLLEGNGKSVKKQELAVRGMNEFIDIAMTAIGESYLATKEALIRQQEQAIGELSTPVLQLRDGLLLLPIIGVIDSHRALKITENLLHAIRANRARMVVMDITGVAAIDSKVANHMLQTVEAARLMGATVIVTGLSAEVAQTLVTIGVDLSRVRTVGDLQGGIEMAEDLLGNRVVTGGKREARNQAVEG